MKDNSSQSLQNHINKVLILRLSLMTLVIAAIIGGLVYGLQRQKMQQDVLEQARQAVQVLVNRAVTIMDEKAVDGYHAFRYALDEQIAQPVQREGGEFIYAIFYKPDNEKIDEYIDHSFPGVEQVIADFHISRDIKPVINTTHVESRAIKGKEYIYVVFPVVDLGKVVAYSHAIFVLSETAEREMLAAMWQAVTAAILIILVTSLLLYPIILQLVKRLSLFSGNLLDANLQSISLLGSAIAKRDSDTDAHNYRVTIYSVRLAQEIGLGPDTIRSLIKGAFLHDVGKIGIRDAILLKPGRLDESEFAIMQTHVQHGLDIVSSSAWLSDARDVVGGHHEKYGGGGYPENLQDQDIPITARIFAIADVFDALTSKRPYKEPMSFEKTMAILEEGSQQHFDPEILSAFKTIAKTLYNNYCGREDRGLHEELDDILKQYFTTDIKSLIK